MTTKQEEVNANFVAFQQMLPSILPTHAGKFALLRHGKIVDYFDSVADAVKHGRDNFSDGLYSVQIVQRSLEDLGYFSHAVA